MEVQSIEANGETGKWVPPLRRILIEVAQKHGLSVADITGPSRKHRLMPARWEYYYREVAETDKYISAISRAVNRDHSCVPHAVVEYAKHYGLPIPRNCAEWKRAQTVRKYPTALVKWGKSF